MLYNVYCCMASNASFKSAPSVAPPRLRVLRLLLEAMDLLKSLKWPFFATYPRALRCLIDLRPRACLRFETILPCLLLVKCFLVKPEAVFSQTPCITSARDPILRVLAGMFSTRAFEKISLKIEDKQHPKKSHQWTLNHLPR